MQLLSLCMGKHQILPTCSLSLRLNFIFEITNEIGQQLCHKCCFLCSNSVIKSLFLRLDQPVRIRGLHGSTWIRKPATRPETRVGSGPKLLRGPRTWVGFGISRLGSRVIKINLLFPNGPNKTRILLNFPECVAYLCVHVKFIFEKRT